MPQNPIAHGGSVTVTSAKAFSASSYSKEWSHATARLNCFWASGVHETVKLTRPSFSEESWWWASCASAEEAPQSRATRMDAVDNAAAGRFFFTSLLPFVGGSARRRRGVLLFPRQEG